MTKKYLDTLAVNWVDSYEMNGDSVFEITNGEKVIMQLKTDGTLLLSGVHIKQVDEIKSFQAEKHPMSMESSIGNQIEAGVEQRTD